MWKFEKELAKKVQETAKNVVKNSVGKSIFLGAYEKKIPVEVKNWVKRQKD
ncbi:MAG TPA: hypothetical protein H9730_07320 [Candidatus Mediterraneibacter stercoripullorum]|nr:hypothetical protein [Candidatus Mediterraneibacter stercoripullorum]